MSKLEIATCLRTEEDIAHKDAKRVVELFFETLISALTQGEEVKLFGFGHFMLRDKRARPGRNPRTGAAVTIAPRRVVVFKAGRSLKKRVS